MQHGPGWRASRSVCCHKIKRIRLNIDRNHILGIKCYDVKRWVLVQIRCKRPCIKVNSNIFIVIHTCNYLNIFLVSVSIEVHSNYMLKSIHNSSISMTPPMYTLCYSSIMLNYNSLSTNGL
jgi:hypothetical protein